MPNLTTNLSADAPANHGGAVSNSSTPDLPSNHGGPMSNSSTSRPVSHSSAHMGAQSASLLASRHNHDVDDHLSNHNDTNENILVHNTDDHNSHDHNIYYYDWNNDNLAFDYDNIRDVNCSLLSY